RWRPACRRREPGSGSCTERENLSPRYCPQRLLRARGSSPSGAHREGSSTVAGHGGRPSRSSDEAWECGWSEGDGSPWFAWWSTGGAGRSQVSEPKSKPFDISKRVVFEAYRRVKANKGAAGVDDESIAAFEVDLRGNLDKLWNRMSSGSYFPPPVKM